jgi:type IV secretory pathway TrbD component
VSCVFGFALNHVRPDEANDELAWMIGWYGVNWASGWLDVSNFILDETKWSQNLKYSSNMLYHLYVNRKEGGEGSILMLQTDRQLNILNGWLACLCLCTAILYYTHCSVSCWPVIVPPSTTPSGSSMDSDLFLLWKRAEKRYRFHFHTVAGESDTQQPGRFTLPCTVAEAMLRAVYRMCVTPWKKSSYSDTKLALSEHRTAGAKKFLLVWKRHRKNCKYMARLNVPTWVKERLPS